MKSILVLTMLFLISCGQSNQQNQVFNKEIESASSQNLAVLTNQGDAFDYGSMLNTASSITKVFKFKNTGDMKASEAPVASISGDSAYSLILQSGCSSLLNVNSTCQVRVMFNPKNKAPGTYKTMLKLGASPLIQQELTAVVTAPLAPSDPGYVAPPVTYSINSYNEVPAVISSLDMGSFSGTQTLTKIVTFKNEGTGSAPLDSAVVSNSTDFSILNQCVSKTLAPNSSCQVRFTFAASGKTPGQAYSSNVTFLGKSIPVSAAMLSVAQAPVLANIISLDGASEVASIDLGTLQQTDSITKIITFKNNGTGSSVVGNSTESDSSNFSYIDQCQNKSLAVNGSCTVRATISAKNKSGPFSTVISFLGKSVTITGNISVADVISYSPTYSSYGSCNAQVCDGQGVQSRTIVKCNKVTNGVAGIVVDNSFCVSFAISANLDKSCASPAGDKTIALSNGSKIVSCVAGSASQSFKSISCNPEFHANGELCVGDVITYSANYSSYGSCNAQACDGQGLQSRTLSSCNKLRNGAQDSIVDNSFCSALNSQAYLDQPCSSPAGNKTVSIANGSQIVSCLEGSTTQSFISVSCNPNYSQFGEICQATQCTVENSGLSNILGVSGTLVSGCVATSCSSNYEVSNGSCSPIMCNLANANIIHSATVSGNLVSGCVADSCDSGYKVQNGICVVSSRSCTIADLSNIGISSSNVATVSGSTDGLDFSLCAVASCNSGYTYSSGSKSCNINTPIIVTATPSQDLIYTKNVVKTIATNANAGASHSYTTIATTGSTPATAAQVGLAPNLGTISATANTIVSTNSTIGTDAISISGTSDVSLANCNFVSIDLGSNCSANNLTFSFNMRRNDIVGSTLNYLLNGFNFSINTKLNTVSQVSTIYAYTDGIGPSVSYNGKLYFSANTSNGVSKLFRYDETLNVIEQVSNTTGDPLIQDTPMYLTVFNNKLYFNAMSPGTTSNPRALYEYDSVTNTVKRISDTVQNTALEDNPTDLTVFNNKLYFAANTSYAGVAYNKLFAYDGTNVVQVTNIAYQYGSDRISSSNLLGIISDYNNKIYVVGSPYGYGKLYEYDPNTALTKQISDINAGTYDNIQFLTKYNNKLYFKANGSTLFSYDGTSINQVFNNDPTDLIVVNGKIYMRLKPTGSSRYKLFEYYESADGLTKTLNQVSNIRGNLTSVEMTNLYADVIKTKMVAYNNKIYFVAQNTSGFNKLWQFDTVSRKLVQISNIVPTGTDEPQYMSIHNGKLYFAARTTTATTPVRLFVFDGL